MFVIVLDPRWPDLIPVQALRPVPGPIEFSPDIPEQVRGQFVVDSIVDGGTLVTTDVSRADAQILAPSLKDPVFQARQTMRTAVRIGEWEASQTHESLLPYLEEEAQEFIEAVRSKAGAEEMKKELGDVLLQVLFHAEIAEEFDFGDVAQSFVDKLKSRAPYLFDGTDHVVDAATQDRIWLEAKAREAARRA